VSTQPDTPGLVPRVLAEYGALTRSAVERYLPAGEPRRYLYDLVTDYPRRGGKAMRPSLCLATACAFGARPEEALFAAALIELLHNATLIHDDIEDESEMRRGRPVLHHLHGVPLALNAGNSLALLSLRPLLESQGQLGPGLLLRILQETERTTRELAEGQALELGWRRDNVVGLGDADYFEMVLKKTGWLGMIFPTLAGALVGTRDPRLPLAPFVRFGFFFGAAFQIRDDVLNLVADGRYGKERDGDLREGKRTLILIHLLSQAAPAERERIAAFLGQPRAARREADVRWLRRQIDRYGSLDYALGIAGGLAGAARHEYSRIFGGLNDGRDKRFVLELISWSLLRDA
jgi:geranylgeranyl diphosphate synthase type II